MKFFARILALVLLASSAGAVGIVTQSGPVYSAPEPSPLYAGYTPTVVVDTSAELLSELASAGPGDIIGLEQGITFQGDASGVRFIPVFAPASSGTAEAPIVIVAKYPAADHQANPELWSRFQINDPETNGSVLGTLEGTDYIKWVGPYIDQTLSPARGSWGTTVSNDSTDISYEKFYWDVMDAGNNLDNFNTLFAQQVTNLVHRGNYYQMKAGQSPNFHNPAVSTYACDNILSEHNYYNGIQVGFYMKGSESGQHNSGTLRLNKSRNMAFSALQTGQIEAGAGVDIINNLSIGDVAFYILDGSGGGPRENIRVTYNTIIDVPNVPMYVNTPETTYDNNTFENNVIASLTENTPYLYFFESPGHVIFDTINYNLIYRASGNWDIENGGVEYNSLAAWQSATGKDANSTTSAPTFVNAGIEDYRLVGDTGSSTGGSRGYSGTPGLQ